MTFREQNRNLYASAKVCSLLTWKDNYKMVKIEQEMLQHVYHYIEKMKMYLRI